MSATLRARIFGPARMWLSSARDCRPCWRLLSRLDSRPQARSHELIEGVPGVASLSHDKVVTANGARVLPIPHYDGFAAWDLVDMDRYRAVWLKRHGYFSLNMAGSRGCSFRCAWCAKPTWGNHYLQRSPGDVAAEMTYLQAHFRSPSHLVCG